MPLSAAFYCMLKCSRLSGSFRDIRVLPGVRAGLLQGALFEELAGEVMD